MAGHMFLQYNEFHIPMTSNIEYEVENMCNLSYGAVFCLANIFVQAAVNGFGETATAGLFTSDA